MSLTAAKRALASDDIVLFGNTYRQLTAKGADDRSLFRLALAADPTLTRDEWSDRVARAALQSPAPVTDQTPPLARTLPK